MDKRRFGKQQRAALWLIQGGKCALCGAELEPGWHADHKRAWSRGGVTDVVNGQALCPTCNLKKGIRIVASARKKMLVGGIELDVRLWQESAYLRYVAESKTNWMLYATPGAGKTQWALMVARMLLKAGVIERVVVVSPTRFIRRQWTKRPRNGPVLVKLQLLGNNGDELMALENHADFEGCSLTYAQIFANPEIHRAACDRYKTLVIFDEVHHAGEKEAWGVALEQAFGLAVRRIGLTGTPWRKPKAGKIPTASYSTDDKLVPDFSFTYGQAVAAGDCRPVEFPSYDGQVTYVEKTDSCVPMREQEVYRLGDAEDDDSPLLKDILRPDGLWMRSIFQKADERLRGVVAGDDGEGAIPDAKGVVFVHSRDEARAFWPFMKAISKGPVAFIISDPDPDRNEPDPQKELEAFKHDHRRWALVVDMVSEGVDIPSLYVGVYASRKKTPLRFLQMVGRFVRMRDPGELPLRKEGKDWRAVVFLPAVKSLMQMAVNVEDELLHAWDEEDEEQRKKRKKREHDEDEILREIETSPAELKQIIFGREAFEEREIIAAVAVCEEFGIPTHYAINMLKVERARGVRGGVVEPIVEAALSRPEKTSEPLSTQDEWEMLKKMVKDEIGKTAAYLGTPAELGDNIAKINTFLMARYGGKRRDLWSLAELRDARQYVRDIRGKATAGGSDEPA